MSYPIALYALDNLQRARALTAKSGLPCTKEIDAAIDAVMADLEVHQPDPVAIVRRPEQGEGTTKSILLETLNKGLPPGVAVTADENGTIHIGLRSAA